MLTFLRQHAAWAPLLVAVLAFCESLAFISLLFPASTALVAIGALIGAGALSFLPIWIAAAVGAALGDWLSYWLGRLLKRRSAGCGRCRAIPICCRADMHSLRSTALQPFSSAAFSDRCGPRCHWLQAFWRWRGGHSRSRNNVSAFIWAAVLLGPGAFGYDYVTRWLAV